MKGAVPSTSAASPGAAAPPRVVDLTILTKEETKQVAKASQQANRKAAKAKKKAEEEPRLKAECLKYERKARLKSMSDYDLETESIPPRRRLFKEVEAPALTVGEFVRVDSALGIVGPAKYGGEGWVVGVRGYGAATLIDVKYMGQSAHKNSSGGLKASETSISMSRVTPLQAPLSSSKSSPRKRARPERLVPMVEQQQVNKAAPPQTLLEVLADGQRRGRKKGWLRTDYGGKGSGQFSDGERITFLQQVAALEQHLSTSKTMGHAANAHTEKYRRTGQFKKAKKKNPLTMQNLCFAWGKGKNYAATTKKGAAESAKASPDAGGVDRTSSKKGKNMINDLDTARIMLTPMHMFCANHARQVRAENLDKLDRKESADVAFTAKSLFAQLPPNEVAVWEMHARAAVARQPEIHNTIIEIMASDPTLSWDQIAYDLDDWCSGSTIGRWMRETVEGGKGYCRYTERILPLLTEGQRRKHVTFARHLRNLWGKALGKYLWIHWDEKWFWGAVRRMAKACPAKGLTRQQRYAYHKNYINKVMGIAVVGYAFDGTPDNGGIGVKIAFTRAQAAKIASKIQPAASGVNANGNTVFQGEILRNVNDKYMVDVCVTGSNSGTTDNPKFALLPFFQSEIFEQVDTLVCAGGQLEGYTPVFQGDSAGPHVEADFLRTVLQMCAKKGWMWEPQGPQMPYMNVCDLCLFPSMSKEHSHLTRKTTSSVAKTDVIWENAVRVWDAMPAATIARSFVLAWRLAVEVVKEKGGNSFLEKGALHQNIKQDFNDTKNGITPRQ